MDLITCKHCGLQTEDSGIRCTDGAAVCSEDCRISHERNEEMWQRLALISADGGQWR